MGFQVDFAPMKLRQGHGEAVCKVLDFLADAALTASGFQVQLPDYPTGEFAEEAVADEEAEVSAADQAIQQRLLASICKG